MKDSAVLSFLMRCFLGGFGDSKKICWDWSCVILLVFKAAKHKLLETYGRKWRSGLKQLHCMLGWNLLPNISTIWPSSRAYFSQTIPNQAGKQQLRHQFFIFFQYTSDINHDSMTSTTSHLITNQAHMGYHGITWCDHHGDINMTLPTMGWSHRSVSGSPTLHRRHAWQCITAGYPKSGKKPHW